MKKNKRPGKTLLILLLIGGLFYLNYHLVIAIYKFFGDQPTKVVPLVDVDDREVYLTPPYPDLGYKEMYSEEALEELHLIGRVNKHGVYAANEKEKMLGMAIRALRYQNITRKVEQKYGIEKNLILAMVMQETGGALLVPNAGDDGGIGLCHMQPYTASQFGLKIYDNCKKMRSRTHGKKLRKLIQNHNSQLSELIDYDDRFHPVKNLDAAGRMIAYYKADDDPLETDLQKNAIRWYAGKYNYKHYFERVKYYQKKISSEAYLDTVAMEFNKINPEFTIGGKPADFEEYIRYFHQINRNYGLDTYQ